MRNFETATLEAITDVEGKEIEDVTLAKIFGQGVEGTEDPWIEEELTAGMFVEMNFTYGYLRYSTFDIDMYYEGDLYKSGDIRDGGIQFSSGLSVDRAKVEIENLTRRMSSSLLNNDQLNRDVTIYVGAIKTDYQIYDLIPMFRGKITGWQVSKQIGHIDGAGVMARWRRRTLRKAQSVCPWPFKSTECGYSGSEGYCSQKYKNCRNKDNYGGFVYLSELQEKKIYWGQESPK